MPCHIAHCRKPFTARTSTGREPYLYNFVPSRGKITTVHPNRSPSADCAHNCDSLVEEESVVSDRAKCVHSCTMASSEGMCLCATEMGHLPLGCARGGTAWNRSRSRQEPTLARFRISFDKNLAMLRVIILGIGRFRFQL